MKMQWDGGERDLPWFPQKSLLKCSPSDLWINTCFLVCLFVFHNNNKKTHYFIYLFILKIYLKDTIWFRALYFKQKQRMKTLNLTAVLVDFLLVTTNCTSSAAVSDFGLEWELSKPCYSITTQTKIHHMHLNYPRASPSSLTNREKHHCLWEVMYHFQVSVLFPTPQKGKSQILPCQRLFSYMH